MASQERFGYEWEKYPAFDPNYAVQFQRWVYPLRPADFAGKSVLDAGCGMGRNSFMSLRWGAQRVTAFDFDRRSVEATRRNLAQFGDRAAVVFQSIYKIEWHNEFDIVFSIGVIHHLENPRQALQNLIRAVKPEGRILIWVYSYEGNEWIVKFVDPLRKYITSRLPVGLVHFLSYFVSIPLWLSLKILYGSTPYLKQLSTFRFRHVHSIVFDQLIPKIANYWTRDQARALLDFPELKDVEVYRPENRTGWIVTGIKK